ncbi:HAD family hydrolase [Candidatus Uhrbacteria bacterium]|nr:HAD family hydrolase [Candidatus Uhrbacteria bacterium]
MRPEIYQKIQSLLFGADRGRVRQWMLGELSSEEICDLLAPQLSVPAESLMDALAESCKNMRLHDDAIPLLRDLRKTARLALVTDNMDCFSRFTIAALRLDEFFDRIVNSSDVRRLKTDQRGRTFADLADEFGVPMSNAFLVDDSRKTCDLFDELGGRAFRVDAHRNAGECLREIGRELSTCAPTV